MASRNGNVLALNVPQRSRVVRDLFDRLMGLPGHENRVAALAALVVATCESEGVDLDDFVALCGLAEFTLPAAG